MNEEIFISTRIRRRNQALLQNLLQVGCIITRIDHCGWDDFSSALPCSKRCELQTPQRARFPAIFPAAIDLRAFGASL